jgi:glycogen(starch) synthase
VLALGNVYPPHHLGGYELIWQGVMRHAREAGHDVRILTTDYRRQDAPANLPDEPGVHRELGWYWRDHEWPQMSPLARLALERRNARIFDRHLRELRPDVITWWPVGGMSLSLIERARRRGVPAAFFVFDYWPAYGPQRDLWTRAWLRRPHAAVLAERLSGVPTRLNLAEAGRWVFCSNTMRDEALAAGLPISDYTVLHAGIAKEFLRAPREQEPPPWRWRLLYVGRVVEQKGVRTAIEMLPLLPEQATLEIVGEGDPPYRRELEQAAKRLGVAERVRFQAPQPRSKLFDIYQSADAVVFPVQWAEPWGLVPLEAMALGRPVVATGLGGSGDYLQDGRNALLFPSGDARALADALCRLADDPQLRQRLVRGGYETAENHSEDQFNESALKEIESTLTASSTARARR